jgi:hypothetical protein
MFFTRELPIPPIRTRIRRYASTLAFCVAMAAFMAARTRDFFLPGVIVLMTFAIAVFVEFLWRNEERRVRGGGRAARTD